MSLSTRGRTGSLKSPSILTKRIHLHLLSTYTDTETGLGCRSHLWRRGSHWCGPLDRRPTLAGLLVSLPTKPTNQAAITNRNVQSSFRASHALEKRARVQLTLRRSGERQHKTSWKRGPPSTPTGVCGRRRAGAGKRVYKIELAIVSPSTTIPAELGETFSLIAHGVYGNSHPTEIIRA